MLIAFIKGVVIGMVVGSITKFTLKDWQLWAVLVTLNIVANIPNTL